MANSEKNKTKASKKSAKVPKKSLTEAKAENKSKSSNRLLTNAKVAKKDEFYTQLPDIERELRHYRHHFEGKVVYLNCDDPRVSNFFHYFSYNFEALKLKKVIATCYKSQAVDLFSQNDSEQAIWLEYTGDRDGNGVPDVNEIGIKKLKGDGDFRSDENIELLRQADIIATNPPFSLFREYIAQLFEYDKKFVVIGHQNAITYKEVFPLIRDNRLWLGYGFIRNQAHFGTPYTPHSPWIEQTGEGVVRVPGVQWFTNLDLSKRHQDLVLYKTYNAKEFPKLDNFDAIEVSKTVDIPVDYDGPMAVPITFLNKYNPDQFEILGNLGSYAPDGYSLAGAIYLNGRKIYKRLLIKRKR